MPGITTPYNLQMPSAGLIGRGSGAGRSTILDAAAVRTLTSTLTNAEVSALISASVANYLPLAGGTVAGILKSGTNNQIFPFDTTAYSTYTANGTGLSFFGAGTGAGYGYCFSGDPLTLTSGGRTEVVLRRTFSPTSGSATFAQFTISPTINQTGGANGASRGLYIAPTITAAADWKAIEVTTGRSCFQAVEAAGNLLLQNATTAVLAEFSKTFTSSTNREYAQIGFSGVNYDFVSRVGSAGGSNQPLRLGHVAADGTTFTGLTVATSGAVTFIAGTAVAPSVRFATDTSSGIYQDTGGVVRVSIGGVRRASFVASGLQLGGGTTTAGAPSLSIDNGGTTGLFLPGAGIVAVSSAGTECMRVSSSAITATGNLTLQNATTAVIAELSKTYTSSTNREYVQLGFTGTNYDFVSKVGSAGGSNQPVRVGHVNSAGTFAGLTVATDGVVTPTGRFDFGGVALGASRINAYANGASAPIMQIQSTSTSGTVQGVAFAGAGGAYQYNAISASVSTTSGNNLCAYLQQNGSGNVVYDTLTLGAGDAFTRYAINGGQNWSTGLDNSDSDAFVIAAASALGTSNAVRIGTDLSSTFYGNVAFGGILYVGSTIQLFPFNGTAYSTYVANGTGLSVFGASGAAGYGFSVSGNTVTLTTGTRTEFALLRTFAPTSGTATFTQILMQPTINQTGGANGISRGLWINPDITAAADWRSLEVSVGKSVLQAVEATTITASGNLTLQNSTTAVTAELSKTFTSSTNREYLQLGFTGTNYDLVSRVGSAGGSNQPIRVGHVNSAGTFAGMTVATTGAVTLNTGYMLLGNSMQVFTFSGGTWSSVATNGGGLSIYSSSTGSGICCAVTGAAANGTSGDHTVLNVPKAFTPTSGSMAYTGVKLNPTVNQTGGASGVSRGLWIDPTLTAAADWRAIEVAAGKTILAASTTTTATLNIPSGTAPTSPVNGDIWSDGSDLKVRLGGVTYTLTKA